MRKDPTQKEWSRLLRLVRREGSIAAANHIAGLVRTSNCPQYYCYRIVRYFLKRGEYDAAGKVLNASRQAGVSNALIDDLYGSWLWCKGRRKRALSFLERKAKLWGKSYMYNQLGALYSLSGKESNAKKYFRLAATLANCEAQRRAKNGLPGAFNRIEE